ncbi:hypothetical protein V6Z11_D11G144500 [Gossypium hirsutum]
MVKPQNQCIRILEFKGTPIVVCSGVGLGHRLDIWRTWHWFFFYKSILDSLQFLLFKDCNI